ncbi:probable RNA-binding protein 19 [Amphibalanus amphitrite]|uniref:probable RNA-binding protein 19 n=1 Tax=Amphibalanus amphitrite TaxID=1232801 RepID=UPI001C921E8A|nr:probable RNA-binding protein 19 [Amphibalanus amphitrite]
MSRIIVKNLPKKVTEETLRETFSAKGYVTDVQLKYTPDGKFRGFAFIGFKTAEQADAAIDFFNGTFIGATKATVEKCASLGSTDKPRAWSKYASGSSAHARLHSKDGAKDATFKGNKKKSPEDKKANTKNKFEEVASDPAFREFLAVHQSGPRATWTDDVGPAGATEDTQPPGADAGDDSVEDGGDSADEPEQQEEENKGEMSDMDFLRSKIVKKATESDDDSSADSDSGIESKKSPSKDSKPKSAAVRKFDIKFTAKITGLAVNAKKKDIRQFLAPLKPKSIRLPPRTKGIAYIGLQTEKELKLALNKSRTFLNGRRLEVKKHEQRTAQADREAPWQEQQRQLADVEPVAETGRIYVRNLAYTVTEQELEGLFAHYGQLTEVTLPVDRYSRKIKGFAFVTFVFPEKAQSAMEALDGSVFQGRMLHLLPAKLKHSLDQDGDEASTDFKARKERQLKKQASSSHNWNSLFLGANAVANLMAEKYGVAKSDVLDSRGEGSAAVRLALGETQLVSETRQFLEEQGVRLDAFSGPAAERSKTVILAKNLPAHTDPAQLREMFGRHGELGRVVLPPSGVTAVIEFFESSEARAAFSALAYTRFKNGPLYLEWAPAEALGEPKVKEQEQEAEEGGEKVKTAEDEEDGETADLGEPEDGATLFVKNINFDTTDDALKEHFAVCGPLHSAVVSRKKDSRRPEVWLSQGYGFVSYLHKKHAKRALKELQQVSLDGHALELKVSNRTTAPDPKTQRKAQDGGKQKSSKILVRNIPFQANKKEIIEVFKTFGELNAVRLPQKMAGVGTGPHRGFAFVEFASRQDAKRAFKALCASTHLYGRRLVLEWAAADDDVETLRLKTAAHFSGADAPSKKRVKLDEEER